MDEKVMDNINERRYWTYAILLAVSTIVFNIAEGVFSLHFGIRDETLSLMGFGVDSFIESISSLGVAHMIIRIGRDGQKRRDKFEKQALKITGWCLVLLAALLTAGAIITIVRGGNPQSTTAGLIIALISILLMVILIRMKNRVGRKLGSEPILADARCNIVCVYMSIVLLIASGLYALFSIPYIDAVGAIVIAWFSFREGRESLEKSKGESLDDCC